MKKLKWLICLCLIVLVFCGSRSYAYTSLHVTDDGIEYVTYSDKYYITIGDYKGTDETVIIPSEIDGRPVTEISGAFFDTKVMKHCTVSEGVYEIYSDKHWVFRNPTSIETVSLPSTLETIGDGAFAECCNLSDVTLPEGLTSIGICAFYNCTGLEKITVPEGVTSISDEAFGRCSNLKTIILPDSLINIDGTPFSHCNPDLTIYANSDSYARTYCANRIGAKFSCLNAHDWDKGTVTTKPTATKDGTKTFTCTACKTTKTQKIAKLGLPRKGKSLTEPKSKNVYKVTKPAAKNGTVELTKPNRQKSIFTVPDTVTFDGVAYKVTSVSKDAFRNSKKLRKVTLGKNIRFIGANAFSGCRNLKTVAVASAQVNAVGKNAFKGIDPKATIKVPKGKLDAYKKLFAKKGQKGTVEIVK